MLVLFATDTVWGIGCHFDEDPEIIYKLKKRDKSKKLALYISPKYNIEEFIELDDNLKKLKGKFMPGPITIIGKNKSGILNYEFLGIRLVENILLWDFIDNTKPIIGTSLNFSGQEEVKSFEEIPELFLNEADIVLIDELKYRQPSTVVKSYNNKLEILREGVIKKEEILNALQEL